MFLFIAAACGGLSDGDSQPVVEATPAEISEEAETVGYDPDDLDDDKVEDGNSDPIVPIQAEVLEGFDMPMLCGHKSVRLFTSVSVLGAYGLGGEDDWDGEAVEATRLLIGGSEYDCFVAMDNDDEWRGNGRSSSSSCDSESDADYNSFQCWWDLTAAARADEFVTRNDDGSYAMAWIVVDGVLYPGSGVATGEESRAPDYESYHLPVFSEAFLVDEPSVVE